MKVLHINTSATAGGAAIAARRIIRAEERYGIEASLYTRHDTPAGLQAGNGQWNFVMERLGVWLHESLRLRHLWAIDPATHGTDITQLSEFQEADIIHLHWINQGMLSLQGLEQLRRSGKPIVWTMHDMWPFTGVCHHADECLAWQDGTACAHCRFNSRLARRTYERKQALYDMEGQPITFVACSHWLADKAQSAPLLRRHRVTAIPNPIDVHFYRPLEHEVGEHGGGVLTVAPSREALRQRLGLPADRRLILFIAYKATDPNKGLNYLLDATRDMDADLVIVGRCESSPSSAGRQGRLYIRGLVNDRHEVRSLYQACDVLAMPTLKDNLPNTIVEAMACGLPCVGFSIGGLPEMIDHMGNGYLANYLDTADLRRGLDTILAADRRTMQSAARLKAIQTYSEASVASRYTHLYEECLRLKR